MSKSEDKSIDNKHQLSKKERLALAGKLFGESRKKLDDYLYNKREEEKLKEVWE